jgi:hypothetical protein
MRKLTVAFFSATILFGASGFTPLYAAPITFNFNTLASGAPSSGGIGANASIQNYMNSVLGCVCVTVTGAVADRTYNGEGYAVGPGNGSKSLTLGTSDGASLSNTNSVLSSNYDTFIANTNDSSSQISNMIDIKFTGGYYVEGPISFDYEIFPDGTANQPPDFTFKALNGSAVVSSFVTLGVTPGTTDGTARHSPNSGSSHNELNQQLIGTWSGTLDDVTELQFIDWPATVAIDNLTVSGTAPVPEPTSIVLLGTGLVAVCRKFRSRDNSVTKS